MQKIDNRKNIDILCFGGEDWWYCNRGHIDMQLMRRYAKYGTTLYVNSIVMQKPNIREGKMFFRRLLRKTKSILTGLKMSHAGFWVYSPFTLPVNHIRWLRPLNEALLALQISSAARRLKLHTPLVWVAIPAACNIARKLRKSKLVYQRTDRFEDTPLVNSQSVSRDDKTLKRDADLTIYVNTSLYEQERAQCKRAFFLDHGVDFDLFALAHQDPSKPADIADIPRPIVGYFGAIEEYSVDIKLIEKVAEILPHVSFVLVGEATSYCSHHLSGKKNIWMLGQKPYESIPHYGKCFDIAILPWCQNRWTEAANPIKLKEYLALGKPFVSTPVFTEMQEYRDVTYVASTPKEFAAQIEQALREDCAERIAIRRKKVEKASWESKAELVLEKLFEKNETGCSGKTL